MAHKRMFSKDITGSDAFLDMPSSSQALYFHLGMEADDDGFIGSPKRVMKVIGTADDDYKILLSKRFVIEFPSGVVVVKHHRINNKWDKYNCKRTVYLDEFSQLYLKENKAYTLDNTQGVPLQSVRSLQAVSRIEENRINNTSVAIAPRVQDYDVVPDKEEEKAPANRYTKKYNELCDWMEELTGVKFVDRRGQFKALKLAREADISAPRLKNRATELWDSGRFEKDGMDWFNVVYSFNKKS